MDYETHRADEVAVGSKVKLPDDPAGRMFVVGGIDRHGMISLWRGNRDKARIEVSVVPSHSVVVHEVKE